MAIFGIRLGNNQLKPKIEEIKQRINKVRHPLCGYFILNRSITNDKRTLGHFKRACKQTVFLQSNWLSFQIFSLDFNYNDMPGYLLQS